MAGLCTCASTSLSSILSRRDSGFAGLIRTPCTFASCSYPVPTFIGLGTRSLRDGDRVGEFSRLQVIWRPKYLRRKSTGQARASSEEVSSPDKNGYLQKRNANFDEAASPRFTGSSSPRALDTTRQNGAVRYRRRSGTSAVDDALNRIRESNGSLHRYQASLSNDVDTPVTTKSYNGTSTLSTNSMYNGIGKSGGGTFESTFVSPSTSTSGATTLTSGYALDLRNPSRLNLNQGDLKVLNSDESFKWAQSNYNKTQRTVDTWSFVLTLRAWLFFVDAKWSYLGGMSEEKQKRRRRALASWVRESILQLGPTFIKLGQLSSTRSDLLPAEFVEELSKLQDRVPAFAPEKAIAFIEAELGQPINELFAEFELQPIAAASLGQVHRAVLFNGEMVVVKVQRPGLKELFDIDLGNLKLIAESFQNSETLGGPSRDWLGIYEECATILYQEIDYINEGSNADRFQRDFRKYPWVKVPAVSWDYTSRKILTLQYCPGIKINNLEELDARQLDRSLIASRAIEAYLIQILRTGFFHADPHPGNLAVDVDGSLIYYDFGMMGEIKSFTKEKLLNMFYAVYEKDAKKVIEQLVDLGALVPTGDLNSVRRSIQFFLENLSGPQMQREATISAIGEDLFSIAVDQPFRFPATFTFVLRAFSTLEGIGKTLDPNFTFAKIAAPYAQELLELRDSAQPQEFVLQQLQKQATQMQDAAVAMPARVARMDVIIRQLEAGDFKLRVRVLEAERAARKANILQVATMNTVAAAGLLNMGVSLTTAGNGGPATASFACAGIFGTMVFLAMKRIQRLDKFEQML